MSLILAPEWIIDGTGALPLTHHAVVVVDSRIEAVTPVAELGADADVVRLPGMTLLPGLINHHVHLILPGDSTPFFAMNDESDVTLGLRAAHNAALSLQHGVTTVRDCGGRGRIVLDTRDAQRMGLFRGARIVACGWTITITGGHTRNFGGEADGVVALRQMVRRLVSEGAEYIKVMASGGGTPGSLPYHPSYSLAELQTIVETAHGLGRTVTAHCTCTAAIAHAIAAGVDCIEHAMFTNPTTYDGYDPQVAADLARSGIAVTPTLQVARDMVDTLPDGPERDGWHDRLRAQREAVGHLYNLGTRLLAGSDAGWRATRFDTFWKELEELVMCSLSPVEAIHAATGGAARAMGHAGEFGLVQPGQQADLLLVEGNAAEDIRCLAHVRAVYQAGK